MANLENIAQGVELSLVTVVFTLIYFLVIDGIETSVCLPRLTKASFKLDFYSILQLWAGYSIACFIFYIIYYSLTSLSDPTIVKDVQLIDELVLGFFVIFLGRIVTKHHGVVQARLFYTTFLSSAFLLLFIRLFPKYNEGGVPGLGDFLIEFSHNISPFISYFLVGSFVMATAGELILSAAPPTKRSLVNVLEKLPSDAKTVTGLQECGRSLGSHLVEEIRGNHHGVKDKLIKILVRKEIKQILCFSKSLWIVERISELESDLNKDYREKVKVIKLPDDVAVRKMAERAYEGYPSIDSVLGKEAIEFDESWNKYVARSDILKKFHFIDYDIGDLRFIITEYADGSRCIMFLTRDKGPIGNIIGMYSEEPHIIETYYKLFNDIWELKQK
jgi:hypothetical protein